MTTRAAQLVLRGEVAVVRLLEEVQNQSTIRLDLKLDVVNQGTRPVILIKQELDPGAESLALSNELAMSEEYLYKRTSWPSVSRAPVWSRWRQHLDSKTPPNSHTWIILPGERVAFETSTSVFVDKPGTFGLGSKNLWEEIRKGSPLWLRVTIETWPTNLEPNRSSDRLPFGEELRERWKAFGDLQLDYLTSEPIPLGTRLTTAQR